MVKKKDNNAIILFIILIGAFIFLVASGIFLPLTIHIPGVFEFGFEPYGESLNQITDLVLVSDIFDERNGRYGSYTKIYTSRYWDIKEVIRRGPETQNQRLLEGNDFDIHNRGNANLKLQASASMEFISTENFHDRDFRAVIFIGSGEGAETDLTVQFITSSGPLTAFFLNDFQLSTTSFTFLLEIKNTPIADITEIFWNGQLVNTISTSEDYKIKINWGVPVVSASGGRQDAITREMGFINPSFKHQFGCTKKPTEQFYVKIFPEGTSAELGELPNFRKFCLEEAPLKIYTVVGSTTDTIVLVRIAQGQSFPVPPGQIWSIEYIGNITDPQTQCELGQVYWRNGEQCIARTLVSLICPSGFTFSFNTGICTIETLPTLFNLTSLRTHQELQTQSKIRFTHLRVDFIDTTPTSFSLYDNVFSSDGIIYSGSEIEPNFPEDRNNWFASFSYGGASYQLNDGREQQLTDLISVKVSAIQGKVKQTRVRDFKAEYTFSLDTGFIDLDYSTGEITVTNTERAFDGGITLTTVDNVGTTIVRTIDKTLNIGDTTFQVDITNLIELRVRPFIRISTPDFNYALDTQNALIVTELNTATPNVRTGGGFLPSEFNIEFIFAIVAIVLLIVFAFIFFRKRRRR